jgi:hypothetical protein
METALRFLENQGLLDNHMNIRTLTIAADYHEPERGVGQPSIVECHCPEEAGFLGPYHVGQFEEAFRKRYTFRNVPTIKLMAINRKAYK